MAEAGGQTSSGRGGAREGRGKLGERLAEEARVLEGQWWREDSEKDSSWAAWKGTAKGGDGESGASGDVGKEDRDVVQVRQHERGSDAGRGGNWSACEDPAARWRGIGLSKRAGQPSAFSSRFATRGAGSCLLSEKART